LKTKKNDFIGSHYILIFIIIIITLYLQFVLIENLNIPSLNILFIILPLSLIGVGAYKVFSQPLFDNLFKSEKNLDDKIKKTLHELNTPVATILLNTKMLEKHLDDEKNKQRLSRIQSACNDLLGLYDDMEYSIKKEIEKIELDEIALDATISQVKERFDELLVKSDISCDINIPSNITILTDKKGFITAISNLFSNAIKYNKPHGTIKIYFKDNILYIEDSGIGIDHKHLFLVFDSFYQENISTKGFGLGLTIVKEFCDSHKITININSKEGNYTIISLDISNIMI
jgi:two-component system, OmpR family, sensor kinase